MEERHGNYYVTKVGDLGSGEFGYVERVIVESLDRRTQGHYAKKIFQPKDPEISKNSFLLEQFRSRFRREVVSQSKCLHSSIVPIYLCNLKTEKPWFIMEVAEGDLLSDIKQNTLSTHEKISIAHMVLCGVQCIHQKNFLHRDIKPTNVLRFQGGVYKVSDFGLVKDTNPKDGSTNLTAIGTRMGTDLYMAPEVVYFAEYSVQTDIYAVGQLIEDLRINDENVIPLIKKCKKLEKSERYKTIDEVLSDFNNISWGSKA
ncbi:serine/threonine-protein kinase [Hafnia paralvei]|uniref:serine/threonine-protein kinase n=1 Tax=Hafnia paralvei TaxID=546367 RepID=UPI0010343B83|nr:serine/threonine-protein kinase [Hafnia paralvei]MDX6913354.1 serine/threonine-protein kinase [Hafnia paralvei]TBM13513.1 serine/threonine protein kinase [Hafnia paralvei]